MNYLKYPLLIILSGIIAIACSASLESYKKEECTQTPSDALVKIIESNCGCHSKDFKTPQDICQRKSMIIDSVVKGKMPRFGSLKPEDKDVVVNWK